MKKIYIILSFIIGIGFTLSSCSDYLDSDYLFDERMSIEDVFTSRAYSDKWLARAYFFLGDNHLLDVASKGYVPFLFLLMTCISVIEMTDIKHGKTVNITKEV